MRLHIPTFSVEQETSKNKILNLKFKLRFI